MDKKKEISVICETCYYLESVSELKGYCRRFPPANEKDETNTYIPIKVKKDEWCGEWRIKTLFPYSG